MKTGHVTLTTPIRGQSVIPRLALLPARKFSNSSFSASGDMIAGIKIIKNGPCDHDHAPFRGGLSSVD